MKSFPTLFSTKEECCGCSACYATCPQNAISMMNDEEGFLYPHIDDQKCVRCYLCLNCCPLKDIKKGIS